MMGTVCCKEFQGWCKSFTKTEIILCVLQAIFLAVFLAFLTFLVLHLVVCSRERQNFNIPKQYQTQFSNSTDIITTEDNSVEFESSTVNVYNIDKIQPLYTEDLETIEVTTVTAPINTRTTLDKRIKCTWSPSQKTKGYTHYYENTLIRQLVDNAVIENKTSRFAKINLQQDSPDGKEVNDRRKNILVALVKIKPQQGITFGCTLTIISEYWTLTAASCIKAIEEEDSLDSFVMMQNLKDQDQDKHVVINIMIHPMYQGVNVTYDLAALQSDSHLLKKGGLVVTLPSLIDYFLITLGEALTALGFGRFRSIDKDPLTRTVREVSLYSLPLSQCSTENDTRAPRHLTGGAPAQRRASGAAPICAGVLRARASPCYYCSGTPLVRNNVLLGIMSDHRHCGVACEPALFVNLARVRDWLDTVLSY